MFWVLGEELKGEIKFEIGSLGFDLVVCSLEKVISTEKLLYDNRMLNEPESNQEPLRNCD